LRSVQLGETETNSALDRFFGYLQWTREGLREFPYPIVLWVTPQILSQLSSKAPDFWSWRGGVFQFVAPVLPHIIVSRNANQILSRDRHRTNDLPIDELLEQVTQIEAKNPNSPTLSTLFDRLGQAYTNRTNGNDTENRAKAIEYFQQALTIQKTLNLKRSQIYTLLRLGEVCFYLGNYEQAELLVQDALTIATKLDDRSGITSAWASLGYIASKRGAYDKAEALYKQSLVVETKLGDRAGMATSWVCLGKNELLKGNLETAEIWLKQALTVMEERQMTWYIAEVNWDLAQIYRAKGEEQTAQEHYSISRDLFIKLGAKRDLERIEKEWL
jgi:tetratricopeptide (TPR) repeat protein